MRLVADLHIHSHYSRATSRNLTIPQLAVWAQRKGVHIVGTGDIAHPGWFQELKESLEPAEEGLLRLKDEVAKAVQQETPPACQGTVRFLLAGEISSIYKKGGKTRKIHNTIFAPSFEAVERIQAALEKIGNIRSDGRPILGLDSRDLLEIVLEVAPQCYLVPAHIWTPWFSLLGSKSGFDSVEECFEDLTPYIFALETGLSSDPPMNWRISALDRYTLVSNSDAHSPQKLAREATLFDTELSYPAMFAALKTGDPTTYLGTIEFFPEEGKYHYDGHRKCNVSWDPKTTLAHNGICPVCGKPVTVGVMHRVETLADREEGARPPNVPPFYSLIPLPEILAELLDVGANSKRVRQEYERLLNHLGPELAILQDIPLDEIAAVGGERLAVGIGRMRRGEVVAIAGYDGEYGVIKLFKQEDERTTSLQMGLFGEALDALTPAISEARQQYETEPLLVSETLSDPRSTKVPSTNSAENTRPARLSASSTHSESVEVPATNQAADPLLDPLNPQQREAIQCVDAPLIIVAGPGTGKTRTLTTRIAYLIRDHGVSPESILAITFTNKAAEEMAERLGNLLGDDVAGRIIIKTFHAFGAMLLREWGERLGLSQDFVICSDEDRQAFLRSQYPDWRQQQIYHYLMLISTAKNQLLTPDFSQVGRIASDDSLFPEVYCNYEASLKRSQALDFDDLIAKTVHLFETHPDVLQAIQQRYRWISVDEYQDINFAQYRLLRLLAAGGANLCVIGDPDQAIYAFRGADRRYFLSFQQDYPEAKMLRLSQNYRSTQVILDAATQVIAGSADREAVQIWSNFVDQVKLDVYQAATDKAEAEYVVHQIERMMGGTSYFSLDSGRVEDESPTARSFGDFAVLYRLRAQSRPLIEAFDRSGIPYQTVGQMPFHARKIVREALAYLWPLHNPRSRLHLNIVLNAGKRNFAPAAVDRLGVWLAEQSGSPAKALQQAAQASGFTEQQRRWLISLASFWSELEQQSATRPVARLVELVHRFLAEQRDLDEQEEERLRQLARHAASHDDSLAAFLEKITLQSETDAYDLRADRVTLMTLHSAKGLEFPVVFIVGCEEGLLPYLPEGKGADVEEERRLFYVGMTRAQSKLILTYARTRFLFGQQMENPPSCFLNDIETALKEVQKGPRRRKKRKEPQGQQLSLF